VGPGAAGSDQEEEKKAGAFGELRVRRDGLPPARNTAEYVEQLGQVAGARYALREEEAAAGRLERRRLKSVLLANPTVYALYELCRIAAGVAGLEAWGDLFVMDRDAVLLTEPRNVFSRSAAQYRLRRRERWAPAQARDADHSRDHSFVWAARNRVVEQRLPHFPPADAWFHRQPIPRADAATHRHFVHRDGGLPYPGEWSTPGGLRTNGFTIGAAPKPTVTGLLTGGTFDNYVGRNLPWDEKWPLLAVFSKATKHVRDVVPSVWRETNQSDWQFFQKYGELLSDPLLAALKGVLAELRRLDNEDMRVCELPTLLKTEITRSTLGTWTGYQLLLNRSLAGKQWIRKEALRELENKIEECRATFLRPDLFIRSMVTLGKRAQLAAEDEAGDAEAKEEEEEEAEASSAAEEGEEEEAGRKKRGARPVSSGTFAAAQRARYDQREQKRQEASKKSKRKRDAAAAAGAAAGAGAEREAAEESSGGEHEPEEEEEEAGAAAAAAGGDEGRHGQAPAADPRRPSSWKRAAMSDAKDTSARLRDEH